MASDSGNNAYKSLPGPLYPQRLCVNFPGLPSGRAPATAVLSAKVIAVQRNGSLTIQKSAQISFS